MDEKILKYISDVENELWDIYDKDRNLTGEKHRRGNKLEEGKYHLVVHVCIFNSKNELLIQQRQPWKKGWPNMWDLSAAGSAVAGENSRKAAEREVEEELGIKLDLSNERPKMTINIKQIFDDYWFIKKDIDISELALQKEEVQAAKWVDKEEFTSMINKGIVVPYFFSNEIFNLKDTI